MSEQTAPIEDPKYWCDLGWKQDKADNYVDAIISFDQALQRNAEFFDAWQGKGDALYSLQRYEEAIDCYERAASLEPECYRVWVNWGLALSQIREYEEAIAYYDRALSIQPKSYRTLWAKGYSLFRLDKFEEALEACDKALTLKQDGHEVWALQGRIFYSLHQHKKALDSHEKALELQQDVNDLIGQVDSLQALGFLYCFNGRMEEGFWAQKQSAEIANELSLLADDPPFALAPPSPNIYSEETLAQLAQLNKLGWMGKLMGFATQGRLQSAIFLFGCTLFAILSIIQLPIRVLWWTLSKLIKRA